MGESVGELSVQELLDSVGDRTTAPGGGAVAGVVAALAGALAGMCGALFRRRPGRCRQAG